ncbi:hypothetical protein QBC35DRAFT_36268 [Podospora australis]|uniref:F-box domain-containing protein n=1 Tax=Podospora australis TaxID=1536484 RepID=A0AAN6WZ89_9PEZI|nr:hypothetical protein QBC35DRAFT_36268 [Podospora australis]
MTEVLCSPQATPMEGPVSPSFLTREEHVLKEQSLARADKRNPRRSQTHHEYYIPPPQLYTLQTISSPPAEEDNPQKQLAAPVPEQQVTKEVVERSRPLARRPPLGPPRRSYSVTDQEPIPHHHRPSTRLQLMDLPSELHFAIFDFLDPIDSTCFGLTNSRLYEIHRRLHGKVRLATRREGPNELEWAWFFAGQHVLAKPSLMTQKAHPSKQDGLNSVTREALKMLRINGQAYCRKCGVQRCQLQQHIKDWMGDGYEYCDITQKFGPVAPEGRKKYCYRCSPRNSSMCGRHMKTKLEPKEDTERPLGT